MKHNIGTRKRGIGGKKPDMSPESFINALRYNNAKVIFPSKECLDKAVKDMNMNTYLIKPPYIIATYYSYKGIPFKIEETK